MNSFNLDDYAGTSININPDGSFNGSLASNLDFCLGFTGHRDKMTTDHSLGYVRELFPNAIWIHGGAKTGFDKQVHDFIMEHKITHQVLKPDYIKYPDYKQAPLRRNDEIVARSRIIIACYDGRRHGGTFYTMNRAKENRRHVCRVMPYDWPSRIYQVF